VSSISATPPEDATIPSSRASQPPAGEKSGGEAVGGESRLSGPASGEPAPPEGFRWLFRREPWILAWGLILFGLVFPPHGFGPSLCGLYMTTGLPCPGCGMTRSVSCLFHGHWRASMEYHPMGWMVALAAAGIASMALWPGRWRRAAARWLQRRERFAHRLALFLILLWLAYGILRFALVLARVWVFPPEITGGP